jgi:hypothetical protein
MYLRYVVLTVVKMDFGVFWISTLKMEAACSSETEHNPEDHKINIDAYTVGLSLFLSLLFTYAVSMLMIGY